MSYSSETKNQKDENTSSTPTEVEEGDIEEVTLMDQLVPSLESFSEEALEGLKERVSREKEQLRSNEELFKSKIKSIL